MLGSSEIVAIVKTAQCQDNLVKKSVFTARLFPPAFGIQEYSNINKKNSPTRLKSLSPAQDDKTF